MSIYVIAGHGHGDSGATGNGHTEENMVRRLAERIKALGGAGVGLHPFSRNAYAQNDIPSLSLATGTQIIELHMDSAAPDARGGHIIIKSGFRPDPYDVALANGISEIFPGRSEKVSYWGNLANANRSAARGYGYRLVECGFITNANDCDIFLNRMDDIARMVLAAFATPGDYVPSQPPSVNEETDLGDTSWVGPKMWSELERQLGTPIDGICSGQSTYNIEHVLFNFEDIFVGHSGGSTAVRALQRMLGEPEDGHFGHGTCKAFQQWLGITDDGYFGPATARAFGAALESRGFAR